MSSVSTENYDISALQEARRRTLALVEDLDDEQMIGPRLDIVNPLRWEIGHVAWFQEYWLLRHLCGREPILANGDAFYDSAKVAHDTRWDLPLPTKAETIAYMTRVIDEISHYIHHESSSDDRRSAASYFLSLALFHEDMHGEAITYTRQTLARPSPRITNAESSDIENQTALENIESDAFVPGGLFIAGNTSEQDFVFDNEQQPFEVQVEPFRISRTATTNGEFARFVEDGGYQQRELWSDDGWTWRETTRAMHPVYWSLCDDGAWSRRNFDRIVPLEEHHPVLHVNWYEADAYCRWSNRRLPTEFEWEVAASSEPDSNRKRRFPWGDEEPTPARANLDSLTLGTTDVRALPDGDSAYGCRQMIGNVWEWTASDFTPYPGFVAGPYKEYSEPWFGNHKVLRGGCWATRARLISNTYRNFYKPDRHDVWAGFRTCAL